MQEVRRRFEREKVREVKWASMLAAWPKHMQGKKARPRLKRRIRKGIPDSLRGEVRPAHVADMLVRRWLLVARTAGSSLPCTRSGLVPFPL